MPQPTTHHPNEAESRPHGARQSIRRAWSFVVGSRSDYPLRAPAIRRPSGIRWVGPMLVLVSSVIGWFAFAGAPGVDLAAQFSLWIGSVSIVLMAWSFVLALRIRALEGLWGGLDSMYRSHRWAGALAVGAMALHTANEPEDLGAVLTRAASESVADAATDLAGTGEVMLYTLVALSIVRLLPYRWWRWTHKLLGVPFAFAGWHLLTAAKPFANTDPWGLWFGAFIGVGVLAWVYRLVAQSGTVRGLPHRVVAVEQADGLTRLELEPTSTALDFEPGQFAFLRLDVPGLREPHPFSIASTPSDHRVVLYIRHLGDWSSRLGEVDLLGASASLEGPYGRFEPLPARDAQEGPVWIAGGVGITPFLSALSSDTTPTPTVLYTSRGNAFDPIIDLLQAAADAGRIHLHLFGGDRRLDARALDELFPEGMQGRHVAICGPSGLVRDMTKAAQERGAARVESEDFDFRQGFGPNRSKEIDRWWRHRVSSPKRRRLRQPVADSGPG